MPRVQALDYLDALLRSDNLRAEDSVLVARALHEARNGADFADALIDGSARNVGCSNVITFDALAHRRLGWTLI